MQRLSDRSQGDRFQDTEFRKTERWRRAVLLAACTVLATAVSCSSIVTVAARDPVEMNAEPAPPVVLQPGDSIDVKFYNAPELNDTQVVLPDGTIYLQLIGRVDAAGKTPTGLREELSERFAGELKEPEVAVIPRNLRDQRIYVGGEVLTPGQLPLPGPLTALEAIMQAGGFNWESAEASSVVVIRHRDGKRYGCSLDLRDALEGREDQPFFLQQHDIVFVPRSPISHVNQWIDQYINKVIPDTGFQWLYDTGTKSSTFGLRPGY